MRRTPDLASLNLDELHRLLAVTAARIDATNEHRQMLYDARRDVFAECRERGVVDDDIAAWAGVSKAAVGLACSKPPHTEGD